MRSFSLAASFVAAMGCAETVSSQAPGDLEGGSNDATVDQRRDAAVEVLEAASVSARDGAADDGSDATQVACLETPLTKNPAGAVVDLQVDFLLNQRALVIGEPNTTASGLTVTPLDLRFFISDVMLRTSNGQERAVDLITSSGALAPYGTQLVVADDLASRTLHLRAAPGTYTGVTFTLGLSDACNAGSYGRKAPLNAASQMTWPKFGYLFLRYQARLEGSATASDGGSHDGGSSHDAQADDRDAKQGDSASDGDAKQSDSGIDGDAKQSDGGNDGNSSGPMRAAQISDSGIPPMVIHMGGFPGVLFAPTVVANGNIAVPDTGTVTARLRMSVDEMLKGAASRVDMTGFSGPPGQEVNDGEQLRLAAPGLMLFDLASP